MCWLPFSPSAGKYENILCPTPDIFFAIRALVKFDISNNQLYEAGTKAIAEALKGNNIMTELNIADNLMEKDGAMDIAKTIPTMGALTSLDVSDNSI